MTEKSKPREEAKSDSSATARASIARMSRKEIQDVTSLLAYTVAEGDFQKFRRALFKLGYDEASADYQKLVSLWDDLMRSSRHP
jgi:hypothetical protein